MQIFQELVDDACMDVAFELHRAGKRGGMSALNAVTAPASLKNSLPASAQPHPCTQKNRYTHEDADIYGNVPARIAAQNFQCANCNRPVNGARYAHHLDRCMGRSSRLRAFTGYVAFCKSTNS